MDVASEWRLPLSITPASRLSHHRFVDLGRTIAVKLLLPCHREGAAIEEIVMHAITEPSLVVSIPPQPKVQVGRILSSLPLRDVVVDAAEDELRIPAKKPKSTIRMAAAHRVKILRLERIRWAIEPAGRTVQVTLIQNADVEVDQLVDVHVLLKRLIFRGIG